MMNHDQNKRMVELIVLPIAKIDFKLLGFKLNTIILFTDRGGSSYHEILHSDNIISKIFILIHKLNITEVAFISATDHFSSEVLEQEITHLYKNNLHEYLTLLVPYLTPPQFSQRKDGKVQSAIISVKLLFDNGSYNPEKFWKIIYDITYAYLNSAISNNIEVVQVGKLKAKENMIFGGCSKLLKNSMLVIPHKGTIKLLKRCLSHLNNTKFCASDINLCFDDMSHKKIDGKQFSNLKTKLKIFLNVPSNVGPYPPRHYSILNSDKEYIFFQDSDDISVNRRFLKQLDEIKKRNLDMIGSHELRVDQFARSLILIRYPLEVVKFDSAQLFYPLFHPSSLITRSAYLKAKGFSTNRRFGYDYQFLLRCCFILKMGNIDDFLYIRFKRPNSLTTNSATKFGSSIRSFHQWRWIVDYGLVKANKLNVDQSSLCVQKHIFDYQLIELPKNDNKNKFNRR